MGDVADFGNFMSAVIDQKAFDRVSGYIKDAKSGPDTKIGKVRRGTHEIQEDSFYVM